MKVDDTSGVSGKNGRDKISYKILVRKSEGKNPLRGAKSK
jgi:hypothetical protein